MRPITGYDAPKSLPQKAEIMSSPTKNEEDRQLNRQGDVVGGSGKEARYGDCRYIVDGSRFSLDFWNVHALLCVLAKLFYTCICLNA